MTPLIAASLALVCQFSQPLCQEASTIAIVQDDTRRYGAYSYLERGPNGESIHLSSQFVEPVTMSAALAHELRNAAYADERPQPAPSRAYCFSQDSAGYAEEAAFWSWYWKGTALPQLYLPSDVFTQIQAQLYYEHSQNLATIAATGCTPTNGWTQP